MGIIIPEPGSENRVAFYNAAHLGAGSTDLIGRMRSLASAFSGCPGCGTRLRVSHPNGQQMCADVPYASMVDDQSLNYYSCHWRRNQLFHTRDQSLGWRRIVSDNSGYCLGTGPAGEILQRRCEDLPDRGYNWQLWASTGSMLHRNGRVVGAQNDNQLPSAGGNPLRLEWRTGMWDQRINQAFRSQPWRSRWIPGFSR